jgi:DNA repair protein RadD
MILRKYQEESVSAVWEFMRTRTGNPCVVLPTAAGKSLVLARLASDAVSLWGGRVLVLAHVKELLEQNAAELQRLAPGLDIGIYSAGLKRRDRRAQVTFAGIQSVYSRACDFDPFDLILVDEAHLIPPDGDGMYQKFLNDAKTIAPHVRLAGLTATPYRLGSGWLCGDDSLLTDVCFEVGVRELIQDGFLSRLTSKEGMALDTSGLHVRGGEFVADEAERLMLDVVGPACDEIKRKTVDRKSVLVFCQSVEHAIRVTGALQGGDRAALITGETSPADRAETIAAFKSGGLKYLVNVNVLTTGFNAPATDAVCLLRPTLSPGLYYQMVGRGFRLAPGKSNCLVLDFGGNVRRHGPVDQIKVKPRSVGGDSQPVSKTCPNCAEVCHAGYAQCPDCGFEFDDRKKATHEPTAATAPVTSLEVVRTDFPVTDIRYFRHTKRNEPEATPTLRVDYRVSPVLWFSEWVCIEHEGFAGNKARSWWRARSNDPFPETVNRAIEVADAGGLAIPTEITVAEKAGEKFPRIVAVKLGEKPEAIEAASDDPDWDFPKPDEDDAPIQSAVDERVYLW